MIRFFQIILHETEDLGHMMMDHNSFFWPSLLIFIIGVGILVYTLTRWSKPISSSKDYYSIPSQKNHNPQKNMFCEKCGMKLSPSDNYCSECGTSTV